MKCNFMFLDKDNKKQSLSQELPQDDTIYKKVGELLSQIAIPSEIEVNCDDRKLFYKVIQRGKYVENGVAYPSMYVTEVCNEVDDILTHQNTPKIYLTCIHPESNNYKFYQMETLGNQVVAKYGRIGSSVGERFGEKETSFKKSLFWIRYYEKLSKGYLDQSEFYLNKNSLVKSQESTTKDTSLYGRLLGFAKRMVNHFLLSQSVITKGRIEKLSELVDKLADASTSVQKFNDVLIRIMALSPRRVERVDSSLAHTQNDFQSIYERENTLLNAMSSLIVSEDESEEVSSFNDFGVEIYEATKEQREEVISKLSNQLVPKVKTIYRVIDKVQKEKFDKYCKENNIKTIKQYWHGSKNENWFSIISTRLKLHPNAAITGKMFGDGIYFAPSSMKSFNYTSFLGTTWARGSSNTSFMGLYATAYGTPKDVYTAHRFNKDILKAEGKTCVHAHAGPSLLNDEIVFYDEDAMLLNYLVEFEQ